MATDLPSSSLILRLTEREPEAWQRFLHLYGPLVYSWCRGRWGLAPADAADLLQEVLLRVLEALPQYRGGNFVAWLKRITDTRVLNHLQRHAERGAGGSDAQQQFAEVADPRTLSYPGELAAPGPDAVGPEALGGVLRRALDCLRPSFAGGTWEAFWQVSVVGRDPADVAHDLGKSANAVYIANSRVLARLRALLGEP
jgi:RNA polymerase sigma-70 factor (ECF subfamily)